MASNISKAQWQRELVDPVKRSWAGIRKPEPSDFKTPTCHELYALLLVFQRIRRTKALFEFLSGQMRVDRATIYRRCKKMPESVKRNIIKAIRREAKKRKRAKLNRLTLA